MTPLNSPALPAVANSLPAKAGAGKPAPEAAEGRDFASALERSRRAAAEDDPAQAATGTAANPRTGKASAAKRGAQDDAAALQAPLVEVLLAAAPVIPAPPASGAAAPAAGTALAIAPQAGEAGAATASPAPAATLPAAAAAAEDAAAQSASSGSAGAQLPQLQPASGADALVAAPTQGPAPARKVAPDAAPVSGATASPAQSAMQPSGAPQLAVDQTVTANAVEALAPRPEAKPHGAPDRMAKLATDPVRDARAASAAAAISAAAAANSGNTQSPSSAIAPRLRDLSAHDDLSSASPLPPAGLVATANATGPAASAAAPAASSAAPAAGAIAPLVGSDAWGAALGHQLVRLARGGGQTAELNINPAHLGPLKITLSVNDNQAQVTFVSAHASVRDAVEAALPQLRASFAETGISLGQTSVGAEARQGAQRDERRTPDRDSRSAAVDGASANTAFGEPSPAAAPRALRMPGLGVDTFA